MLQLSKVMKSRNEWRKKAVQKTYEAKEARKAKTYYTNTILELRNKVKELELKLKQIDKHKKKRI
jgi:hypothetical protein